MYVISILLNYKQIEWYYEPIYKIEYHFELISIKELTIIEWYVKTNKSEIDFKTYSRLKRILKKRALNSILMIPLLYCFRIFHFSGIYCMQNCLQEFRQSFW